jgi:hypothetical protein
MTKHLVHVLWEGLDGSDPRRVTHSARLRFLKRKDINTGTLIRSTCLTMLMLPSSKSILQFALVTASSMKT